MQIYKNSVIVTTLISIVSFSASFVLKFYLAGKEVGFWYDISIGVFGGAILTLITSVIGYRVNFFSKWRKSNQYSYRQRTRKNGWCRHWYDCKI